MLSFKKVAPAHTSQDVLKNHRTGKLSLLVGMEG
jgi:hypothetical protein